MLAQQEADLEKWRKAYCRLSERIAAVAATQALPRVVSDEAPAAKAIENELALLKIRLRRQTLAAAVLVAIAAGGLMLIIEGQPGPGAAVLVGDLVLVAAAYRWATRPSSEMPWPFIVLSLIPNGIAILAYFVGRP